MVKSGTLIGLGVSFVAINLYVTLITSHAFNAWAIRSRSGALAFVLRSEHFARRAENADEIAERLVRWFRPVCFIIFNLLFGMFALVQLRKP